MKNMNLEFHGKITQIYYFKKTNEKQMRAMSVKILQRLLNKMKNEISLQ